MGKENERVAGPPLPDPQGVFSRKALFSLLSGFVLCAMAIYPTWVTLELSLVLVFLIMSALCVCYVFYAIDGFNESSFLTHSGMLFYGVSDYYLLAMAALSLFGCLRVIDPTCQAFGFTMAAAVLLAAAGACVLFLSKRQEAVLAFSLRRASVAVAGCLVLLVALTRLLALVADASASYMLYCAASALLVAWLSLGYLSLREFSKRRWTLIEEAADRL